MKENRVQQRCVIFYKLSEIYLPLFPEPYYNSNRMI